MSLFHHTKTISAHDVAEFFSVSPCAASVLCLKFVERGFLVVADPSKKASPLQAFAKVRGHRRGAAEANGGCVFGREGRGPAGLTVLADSFSEFSVGADAFAVRSFHAMVTVIMRHFLVLDTLLFCTVLSACSPVRQSSTIPPSTAAESAQSESGTVTIKDSIGQYTNPKYIVVAHQPSVIGLTDAGVQRDINRRLASHVKDRIGDFTKPMQYQDPLFFSGGKKWSQDILAYPVLISPRLISLYFVDSRDEGGTHPNETTFSFDYVISAHSELALSDLVLPGHLRQISDAVIARLIGNLKASGRAEKKRIRDGVSPEPAHYKTFAIGADGLHFYFDPYQVSPHSEGIQDVLIDPTSIQDALTPLGKKLLLTTPAARTEREALLTR